jgi:hypothetical protein
VTTFKQKGQQFSPGKSDCEDAHGPRQSRQGQSSTGRPVVRPGGLQRFVDGRLFLLFADLWPIGIAKTLLQIAIYAFGRKFGRNDCRETEALDAYCLAFRNGVAKQYLGRPLLPGREVFHLV